MFLARSYSLERGSADGPEVPLCSNVKKPLRAVDFGVLLRLPENFPFFISGAAGRRPACCVMVPALVFYHHPARRYFNGTFLLGTCGTQEQTVIPLQVKHTILAQHCH